MVSCAPVTSSVVNLSKYSNIDNSLISCEIFLKLFSFCSSIFSSVEEINFGIDSSFKLINKTHTKNHHPLTYPPPLHTHTHTHTRTPTYPYYTDLVVTRTWDFQKRRKCNTVGYIKSQVPGKKSTIHIGIHEAPCCG